MNDVSKKFKVDFGSNSCNMAVGAPIFVQGRNLKTVDTVFVIDFGVFMRRSGVRTRTI